MIKVVDTPRINRYAVLANIASIGGMLLLLASVAVPMFLPSIATVSIVFMLVGMVIAMLGIYYANRWVRKPRPEEQIEKALKGLGEGYVLCHYPRMPIDHILLTPFGIVVIEAISYAGHFTYRDGKWKEAMTMGRAMRYIVEEHLGNPTEMAASEAELLRDKIFHAGMPVIPIKALVLFSHPGAQLDVNNPPVPVCKVEKLRKQVEMSGTKLSAEAFGQIHQYLEKQTI
jgi:hypothetical protein